MGQAAPIEETEQGEEVFLQIVIPMSKHFLLLLSDLVARDLRPVKGETGLADLVAGFVDLALARRELTVDREGNGDVYIIVLEFEGPRLRPGNLHP